MDQLRHGLDLIPVRDKGLRVGCQGDERHFRVIGLGHGAPLAVQENLRAEGAQRVAGKLRRILEPQDQIGRERQACVLFRRGKQVDDNPVQVDPHDARAEGTCNPGGGIFRREPAG